MCGADGYESVEDFTRTVGQASRSRRLVRYLVSGVQRPQGMSSPPWVGKIIYKRWVGVLRRCSRKRQAQQHAHQRRVWWQWRRGHTRTHPEHDR